MANKFTISTTFKAHDKMTKTVKNMNKSMAGFNKTLRLLKAAVVGGIVFKGFQFLTKEASKIEDATAAFTPLMGGVEKANKLVEELNITASTTPFQFENISKAAMQLLPVMNQDIEKTISTFRMLGDTAGGNAQKLDSIARGFTKAMLKGKPDMEALNMIAEAGVPIFTEMAKSMGISKEKLFDMSKAGKLTTDDLIKTFRAMTSEGGIFYKGMEIASKTLTGRLSTLKDNIKRVAAKLGNTLLPILKPIIDKLIELAQKVGAWVDNNQELIRQRLGDFIRKLKEGFGKLAPKLKIVWGIFQDLWPAIKKAWGFISELASAFAGSFFRSVKDVEGPLSGIAGNLGSIFDLMASGEGKVRNLTTAFKVLGLIIGGAMMAGFEMLNSLLNELNYFLDAMSMTTEMKKAIFLGDKSAIAANKTRIAGLKAERDLRREQNKKFSQQYWGGWMQQFGDVFKQPETRTSADILSKFASAMRGSAEAHVTVDVEFHNLPDGVGASARTKQTGRAPAATLNLGPAGLSGARW